MYSIAFYYYSVVVETISNLWETVEKQKKELDQLKSKGKSNVAHHHHTSNSTIHGLHRDLGSTHDKPKKASNDLPVPIKKRKVATAPPPKTYTGFTSTLHGLPLRTSHYTSSSIVSNIPKATSAPEPAPPTKTDVPCPPIITPSSWRSGQEHVNRLIGKQVPPSKYSTSKRPHPPAASSYLTSLKRSNANAVRLLRELERDHDDDNVEEDESEDEMKEEPLIKRRVRGPSTVAIKLRRVLENSTG